MAGCGLEPSPIDAAALVRDHARLRRRRGPRRCRCRGSRSTAAPSRIRSSRSRRWPGPGRLRNRRPRARLTAATIRSTRPSPWISSGVRRNRSSTRFGLPPGSRSENSVKLSRFLRLVASAASESRKAAEVSSAATAARSTKTSASVSSPSSRTSGFVNAAWAGPRRPRIRTSRTLESASASIAYGAVSVHSSSSTGENEHPGDVGGDVAVADHDDALAAEVELAVGEVGMAVVPGDELGRGVRAGQVLAGDAELAVGRRRRRPRRPRGRGPASSSALTSRPTVTWPKKR